MGLIFVYGTLKRGNGLHSALEGAEFISEAITLDPIFKMFCNGAFPHVSNVSKGGYRISGELYKVSDEILQDLDLVEGHPNHYRRVDIEFMLEDGSRIMGQMYIYNGSGANHNEITSGCWFPPAYVKPENNPKRTRKKFDNLATVW